jgi:DNA repair protein RecO (recombination protein O)
MTVSSRGIILRTRPLTETSLIVHWLTPDWGRVATVAKGARRPKSPFLGKLDLFYLAEFSFSRSRRGDLHVLREVGLRETRSALRDDILKLRQAAYSTALVEQTTETETPLPGVFELMNGFLGCLCREKPTPQLVFAFELKLLREIGLAPDWNKTELAVGTKKTAMVLAENDWPALSRLKPSRAQNEDLRRFLHGFLIYHLERLPKGRSAALAREN